MLWFDKKYYTSDLQWDFIPPEHRPGGARALHDDWLWPFSKIPRTWTSFKIKLTCPGSGSCLGKDYFLWHNENGFSYWMPKPWYPQCTQIWWFDGYGIYYCFDFLGYRFRFGPRISDDLENGPGYVYVNYIPMPVLGWFLTFGVKKINNL